MKSNLSDSASAATTTSVFCGDPDRPQGPDSRTPDSRRRPRGDGDRGGCPARHENGLLSMVGDDDPGRRILQDLEAGGGEHLYRLHEGASGQHLADRLLLDRPADRKTEHRLDARHSPGTGSLRAGHGTDSQCKTSASRRPQYGGGDRCRGRSPENMECWSVWMRERSVPGWKRSWNTRIFCSPPNTSPAPGPGEQDLEKALLKLVKIGAKVTGVTMGDKGSIRD